MFEKDKLLTFYDVWRTLCQEYYLGDEDTMINFYPDDDIFLHPELTSEESKELDIRIRVDVLLSKATSNRGEFETLRSIPDQIGVGFMPYFSSIELAGLDPDGLKSKLFDDFCSHEKLLEEAHKKINHMSLAEY